MKPRPVTFEQAKARYVNRFTMEHIPAWAKLRPCDQGGTETRYHAPQFRTDQEWYDNTYFYPETGWIGGKRTDAYTRNQSWPLGQWLSAPFKKGV